MRRMLLFGFIIILLLLSFHVIRAEPTGAGIVSSSSENATAAAAGSITTAGGSFTTLVLNATTQSPRWKAYVGNVSGSFALRNANNYTLYDWQTSTPSGEVYASRNNSIVWSAIACANVTFINAEQTALNISTTSADSINRTFNRSVHRSFYVGTTLISNSTCPAIATYINSTAQNVTENATFQEVLLRDSSSLVYAALIDQNTAGFNTGLLDFQMIVPEEELAETPHTYYFYLELS